MKKQLKKGLSLFLAVLMVMTCWVWVAPETALAADTVYNLTVDFAVTNNISNSSGAGAKFIVKYLANNGTATTEQTAEYSVYECFESETEDWSRTFEVPGFPTQVALYVAGNNSLLAWDADVVSGTMKKLYINGTHVWGDGDSWVYSATAGGIGKPANQTSTYATYEDSAATSWVKPYIAKLAADSDIEIVGKKLGTSTAASGSTTFSATDNYGVGWANSFTLSSAKVSSSDAGSDTVSNTSVSISANKATANILPDVQTNWPSKGLGKYYLYVTYGSASATANITINFPSYTITFDGNGGKLGYSDNSSQQNKDTIAITEKLYGDVIGSSPDIQNKTGFDFIGYFSTKYSDSYTLETPTNYSGKFVDKSTTVDSSGDRTYYAAWEAKKLSVTFKTADHQTIATLPARYNRSLNTVYNGLANLNAQIAANNQNAKVTFGSDNCPVYKSTDGSEYVFSHWKMIEAYDLNGKSILDSLTNPNQDTVLLGNAVFEAVYTLKDKAEYTVSFYGTDGNVISTKTNYNFNDEIQVPSDPTLADSANGQYTYEFLGWATRQGDLGAKYYTLDEADMTEDGAVISYYSKDIGSMYVKGNAEYVPVFRRIVKSYDVKFNYKTNGDVSETETVSFKYGDQIVVPDTIAANYTDNGTRYYLTAWTEATTGAALAQSTCNGEMTFNAVYGNSETAVYSIKFYNRSGELIEEYKVEHGAEFEAPAQGSDKVPSKESDDNYEYNFKYWSTEANGAETKVEITPTSDANYYAVYEAKQYANIAFWNGTQCIYALNGKENNLFVGDKIPVYNADKYGTPAKAEDNTGTYTFNGWKYGDTAVTPGETVITSADTVLYADYKIVYKEYTVKFVNGDATVIEKTYHYGDAITIPEDPTKAADETYTYEFKGWSPDVAVHCYGNATYEAQYRNTYINYPVTWYKDDKATIARRDQYIYNTKIIAPTGVETVKLGTPIQGYEWVLDYWVKCDKDGTALKDSEGNEIKYVRGDRASNEEAYYYPVYKEVGKACTVTFYDEYGTTKLGSETVSFGTSINDVIFSEPLKAADDTYHYDFAKWIERDTEADVTTINGDISVKATFEGVKHSYSLSSVETKATCTNEGWGTYSCSCGKSYEGVIDIIPDTAAPDAQAYLGSNKWTRADYNTGINYDDVVYACPTTDIIINTVDLGSISKANPEATLTRRVGEISYHVSQKAIDPKIITDWTVRYSYDETYTDVLESIIVSNGLSVSEFNELADNNSKKVEILAEAQAVMDSYEANATGRLENIKGLEDGKEYIIYIKVSDRVVYNSGGNVKYAANTTYMSTGKFHYGTVAPTIKIDGEGYGMRFCKSATISVEDDFEDLDGVKVTINGNEVELNADGEREVSDKGTYIVSVTDKSGNTVTKSFEIAGAHTYKHVKINATCETAGKEYDLCTRCGATANETTTAAKGHKYVNYIETAPTCVDDGWRVYTCSNGCGKTATVKTSADATANGIIITDEELAALKASGKHTYAKVLDEEGKETEEDKWTIDKAATCKVEGSKHKTCTKCGEIATETIPVETVNGHKYYSAKVAQAATCTEDGWKNRTCRYCGYVDEKCETILAKGHTEGEYVVTKKPTCTEKGTKILTCEVCNAQIGEPDKDGNFDVTKTVEIAALGHLMVYAKTVKPEDDEEDGKGYILYKCARGCDHTEKKEYVAELLTYTITFNNYDGNTFNTFKTIKKRQGETATALEIGTPTRESDETYKYTFDHWEDENGKEVTLPITAEKDTTLTAVYAEKYVYYTVTYNYEDGSLYKNVSYNHYNSKLKACEGPKKSEDKTYSYEFAGWKDVNGNVYKTGDAIEIKGNISLTATYSKTQKEYTVIYQIESDAYEKHIVKAGDKAPENDATVRKDADTKYHYTFKSWDKAAALEEVYTNITARPGFNSVAHTFTQTVKTAATCTANAVITYSCTGCDYSYEQELANSALGHDYGDPVYDSETGKYVKVCNRCHDESEDVAKFTVTFWVGNESVKTVNYNIWGTKLAASKLPANPTKAATDEYTYTFKGWALKDDETETIVDPTTQVIKNNMDYVAIFTATKREYTVIFAYDAKNTIKTVKNVPYGTTVKYDGAKPTKNYDESYHYTFAKWSDGTALNGEITVKGDVYVTAVFDKSQHSYTPSEISAADCTHGTGTRYTCNCGYYDDKTTGKALGHKWTVIDSKTPTQDEEGYIIRRCDRCHQTETEILEKKSWIYITIVAKDTDGEALEGALVSVYDPDDGNKEVAYGYTDKNGYVTLAVPEAKKYHIRISYNEESFIETDITVNADGSYSGSVPALTVTKCSCACHRDGLWSSIFRFFHKIIKMLTGEFKCCKDPDSRYYN